MAEIVQDSERSPKGDHNRRIAMCFDVDQFAGLAGVSSEALHEYEMTSPDHTYDLDAAHRVGVALERLESGAETGAPLTEPPAPPSVAPAFASGDTTAPAGDPNPVRPAGAAAMRDTPSDWDEADQAADESFPASDAPANNRFD